MVELADLECGGMTLAKLIYIQTISSPVFDKYGHILNYKAIKPTSINQESCLKYGFDFDLCISDADDQYRSKVYIGDKHEHPITIETMEKHPLGFQLFYPLTDNPFIVVVAPGHEEPDEESIEAFLVPTGVGVVIRCDTWHHSLLSLYDKSRYFVIENDVPLNCQSVPLKYIHEVVQFDITS